MATTRCGGDSFTLTATNGVARCTSQAEQSYFSNFPRLNPMPTIRFFCIICGTGLRGTSDSRDHVTECPSCTRRVPVPQLADIHGDSGNYAPVLPPDVLELSVKFLCAACRSPLRADARWEGRTVVCPVCGDKTGVPRWSRVTHWPRSQDSGKGTPSSVAPDATKLSEDEIAFLSTTTLGNLGGSA